MDTVNDIIKLICEEKNSDSMIIDVMTKAKFKVNLHYGLKVIVEKTIMYGRVSVMKALVKLVTLQEIKRVCRMSLLGVACKYRKAGIIKVLIEDIGIHVNDPCGWQTPLEWTITNVTGDILEVVRTLVERGAVLNATRGSILYSGIQTGSVEVCEYLIRNGVNVNTCEYGNDSPLLFAIRHNASRTMLEMLIARGADMNTPNKSALVLALEHECSRDIVTLLIEHGVDIACEYQGQSVMMVVVKRNYDDEMLEMLLEAGADAGAVDNYGNSPLHYVVKARPFKLGYVERLIKAGVNVNGQNLDGNTPLITAILNCMYQTRNVIELLIALGADVNLCDNSSSSPLLIASRSNQLEVVKLLVESGAYVNSLNNELSSPLTSAIVRGELELIQFLVKSGADVDHNANGCTPLMDALAKRRHYVATCLIEAGAVVSAVDRVGVNTNRYTENSPLLLAIKNNAGRTLLEMLIARGADMNTPNKSALVLALEYGCCQDIVMLLIEHGVDIACEYQGQTAIMVAAKHNRDETLQMLLEAGADAGAVDKYDNSPLHYVVKVRPFKRGYVERLIKAGVNVNGQNLDGNTPLITAILNGMYQTRNVIELLIALGADVNLCDNTSSSPLLIASRSNQLEVVKLLVESGAYVNSLNNELSSPLTSAIVRGELELIQFLVKSGADVDHNANGCTPLMDALANCKDEVVVHLIEAGASVTAVDRRGNSVFMYGIKHGASVDNLKLCLNSGADANVANEKGEIPLFHALRLTIKRGSYGIEMATLVAAHTDTARGVFSHLSPDWELHATFDLIHRLCVIEADVGAKCEPLLNTAALRTAECGCARCYNHLRFLIVERNLPLWNDGSYRRPPFVDYIEQINSDEDQEVKLYIQLESVKLFIRAGYLPQEEEIDLLHPQIKDLIRESREQVPSLLTSAALTVRRALGRRLPVAIQDLPLPDILKNHIKLEDIVPMEETDENCWEVCATGYYMWPGDSDSDDDYDDLNGYDYFASDDSDPWY